MMAEAAVSAGVMGAGGVSLDGGAIEIRDTAINVEDVMARIRNSIEDKKKSRVYRQDALLAQGTDLFRLGDSNKSLTDHLALLRFAARIDLEGEPVVSHRAFMGFAIKWVKQLSRFWIRKYTDSLFAKQNYFNAELIAILSELNQQIEDQKAENRRLREQLEALSQR